MPPTGTKTGIGSGLVPKSEQNSERESQSQVRAAGAGARGGDGAGAGGGGEIHEVHVQCLTNYC